MEADLFGKRKSGHAQSFKKRLFYLLVFRHLESQRSFIGHMKQNEIVTKQNCIFCTICPSLKHSGVNVFKFSWQKQFTDHGAPQQDMNPGLLISRILI